jgi:hypothetical protein
LSQRRPLPWPTPALEPFESFQELVCNLPAIGGQPQLLHFSIGVWRAVGGYGFANSPSAAGKGACNMIDLAMLGELAVGRLVNVDTLGHDPTRDVNNLDDACGQTDAVHRDKWRVLAAMEKTARRPMQPG